MKLYNINSRDVQQFGYNPNKRCNAKVTVKNFHDRHSQNLEKKDMILSVLEFLYNNRAATREQILEFLSLEGEMNVDIEQLNRLLFSLTADRAISIFRFVPRSSQTKNSENMALVIPAEHRKFYDDPNESLFFGLDLGGRLILENYSSLSEEVKYWDTSDLLLGADKLNSILTHVDLYLKMLKSFKDSEDSKIFSYEKDYSMTLGQGSICSDAFLTIEDGGVVKTYLIYHVRSININNFSKITSELKKMESGNGWKKVAMGNKKPMALFIADSDNTAINLSILAEKMGLVNYRLSSVERLQDKLLGDPGAFLKFQSEKSMLVPVRIKTFA